MSSLKNFQKEIKFVPKNNEENKKNLYAESKFMLPPDPIKLPLPFESLLSKKEKNQPERKHFN